MKIDNVKVGLVSISVFATYFVLRFAYEFTKIKIINSITSIISFVAGIVMFIISLKLFIHDKNKKEYIQLIVISILLITINVIEYLIKKPY